MTAWTQGVPEIPGPVCDRHLPTGYPVVVNWQRVREGISEQMTFNDTGRQQLRSAGQRAVSCVLSTRDRTVTDEALHANGRDDHSPLGLT